MNDRDSAGLTRRDEQPLYSVEYGEHNIPHHLPAGITFGARLTLRNTGALTWMPNDPMGKNVDLVLSLNGVPVGTYQLPWRKVTPHQEVTVPFPLKVPDHPGKHELQLELTHQHVTFFRDRGVPPLGLSLEVDPPQETPSVELFELASRLNPWHYHPSKGIGVSSDGSGFPLFVSRAHGSKIWDLEGLEYIDYTMGWGSVLLGHGNDRVQAAVRQTLGTGAVMTPFPHPLELEVSQMLVEGFPCAEMVTFGKNGSDVCTVAARLARIHTGKRKILFSGYHGWQDFWVEQVGFQNTGVPDRPELLIHRFKFNDIEDFLRLFHQHRDDLAGVMLEPSGPWGGDRVGPEADADRAFLQTIADATRETGALLIFDEIVTGFRYPGGGVQRATGVVPDVACLGKALASGMPLSAIVSSREIMTRSLPRAHYGPTFKGEILSFAAAKASLEAYRDEPVAEHVWDFGSQLKNGINDIINRAGVAAQCKGPPFRMAVIFDEPNEDLFRIKRTLWVQELLKRRVVTYFGVMMPSYAHDEGVLQQTLDAVRDAIKVIAEADRKGNLDAHLDMPLL